MSYVECYWNRYTSPSLYISPKSIVFVSLFFHIRWSKTRSSTHLYKLLKLWVFKHYVYRTCTCKNYDTELRSFISNTISWSLIIFMFIKIRSIVIFSFLKQISQKILEDNSLKKSIFGKLYCLFWIVIQFIKFIEIVYPLDTRLIFSDI